MFIFLPNTGHDGGSEGKVQWSLKVIILRQTTEVPDIFNSGMLCVCGKGQRSF